jgi:hypothetical protein
VVTGSAVLRKESEHARNGTAAFVLSRHIARSLGDCAAITAVVANKPVGQSLDRASSWSTIASPLASPSLLSTHKKREKERPRREGAVVALGRDPVRLGAATLSRCAGMDSSKRASPREMGRGTKSCCAFVL